MTYQISPYTYKDKQKNPIYTCFCLHSGKSPTQDNIVLEATKLSTLEHYLSSLEGKAK